MGINQIGNVADQALLRVGRWLRESGYRFITPTPLTHARVNARPAAQAAHSLTDIFGWSRPFAPELLPEQIRIDLAEAGALTPAGDLLRAGVRFSTLHVAGDLLFVHSSYPTADQDAVFFGPDTYRFARFIAQHLADGGADLPRGSLVDIGCGSGAGGLLAQRLCADRPLVLGDVSKKALHYAWVNTRLNAPPAGTANVDLAVSDVLGGIAARISLIVANPPYLLDPEARLYRDGGGELGSALSTRMVRESLDRLAPGGKLLLYTGVPMVRGGDPFFASVRAAIHQHAGAVSYEELDPDVFGEELDRQAYAQADRIAAVGLAVTKNGAAPRNSSADEQQ